MYVLKSVFLVNNKIVKIHELKVVNFSVSVGIYNTSNMDL